MVVPMPMPNRSLSVCWIRSACWVRCAQRGSAAHSANATASALEVIRFIFAPCCGLPTSAGTISGGACQAGGAEGVTLLVPGIPIQRTIFRHKAVQLLADLRRGEEVVTESRIREQR